VIGLRWSVPAEDRQRKGRFGDEDVTALWFEWRAGGIVGTFVVTGRDPHFAVMLHSNLRGSQNVAGGMERDLNAIEVDRAAVVSGLDARLASESMARQRVRGAGAEICARPGSEVVTVRMRDHRSIHRLPRIDVKSARLAEQPVFGRLD
jgi:hypothetical protein